MNLHRHQTLITVLLPLLSAAQVAMSQPVTVQDVLSGMEAFDQRFQSRVEVDYVTKKPASKFGAPSGIAFEVHTVQWKSDQATGKMSVDVTNTYTSTSGQTIKHPNGGRVMVFDGRKTIYLEKPETADNRASAMIDNGLSSNFIDLVRGDGVLHLWRYDVDTPYRKLFNSAEHHFKIASERSNVGDLKTVRMEISLFDGKGYVEAEICPTRSFLPIFYRMSFVSPKGREAVYTRRLHDLKADADGIWFPTRIEESTDGEKDAVITTISRASFSAPASGEVAYEIPEKTVVNDRTTGQVYIVLSKNGEEHSEQQTAQEKEKELLKYLQETVKRSESKATPATIPAASDATKEQ